MKTNQPDKTINNIQVLNRNRMKKRKITKNELLELSKKSELRKIANNLGDSVNYFIEAQRGPNFGLEFLFYGDKWVDVGGVDSLLGESPKRISYTVDVTKVDFYIPHLEQHGSKISREIAEHLRSKSEKDRQIPEGIAKQFFYCAFGVKNFNDLPRLIKLHQRIYNP